ncbi:hypothetical protein ACL655_11085 [Klebsiella quasipneumoniae subsp. similipneumoniae]
MVSTWRLFLHLIDVLNLLYFFAEKSAYWRDLALTLSTFPALSTLPANVKTGWIVADFRVINKTVSQIKKIPSLGRNRAKSCQNRRDFDLRRKRTRFNNTKTEQYARLFRRKGI